MKKTNFLLLIVLLCGTSLVKAQTNTFPATGNVGIGTLTPTAKLQVIGATKLGSGPNNASIDNKGNLVFNGTATYKVKADRYVFRYSADTNYGMFFSLANLRYELRNSAAAATFFVGANSGNGYFAGNLGLGVQAPTAKLDVAGAVKIADGTQGAGKVLTSSANGTASWQTPPAGVTGGEAGRVAFWTGTTTLSNTKYLSWDNTNVRLGIGVGDLPHAQLHLDNTLASRKIILREQTNDDNQFYGFGTNTNALRYQVSTTAADHVFYAGSSTTTSNELMRIKGNGNVGIGTATPNAPLQFASTFANRKIVLYEPGPNDDHQFYGFGINSAILRYQVSNVAADHVFYAAASATTSTELMRIKGNGNVSIGNTSATAKLNVGGNVKIADGTQGAGKVLTSDGSGTASWQTPAAGVTGGQAGKLAFWTGATTLSNNSNLSWDNSGGRLSIGASPATGYLLTVAGKIIATEITVQAQPFPDYVFDGNYKLPSLAEVEDHINTYHRLPGMPAAADIESNGMQVGKMQVKVVEKVEEATLYILQLNKENQQLKLQLETVMQTLTALQAQIDALKK